MNYNKACKYLEFKKNDEINENTIKKQYRMLALTYHPDKNKNPESTAKFQEINEAKQKLLEQSGGNAIEYLFVNKRNETILSYDECGQYFVRLFFPGRL